MTPRQQKALDYLIQHGYIEDTQEAVRGGTIRILGELLERIDKKLEELDRKLAELAK